MGKIMQEQTIKITSKLNKELQDFLNSSGEDKVETIHTLTAVFENDIEVDIKVCNGNPPFVDPVLFQDGNDHGCLDVSDTLVGEYLFSGYLKDTYKVIVEIDDNLDS